MNKERILHLVRNYVESKNRESPFVPTIDEIPVSGTIFTPADIVRLVDVAMDGWVTEGKYSSAFITRLSEFTGIPHVVLCNSGSSADLLAMTALVDSYKTPKNSLIVTSALAFPTTVSPIIQCGMIPYFVDINPHTLNPDIGRLIELAKHREVGGIILSHTLGFPYDEAVVAEAFANENKWFIADSCDALGATVNKRHVGSFADATTLSFFPAHHISTGEGGAVLCKYGGLFKLIRSYCNWGRDCWCKPGENNTCNQRFSHNFPHLPEEFDHKYTFSKIGYNLKMTDLQAALGFSQTDEIKSIVKARKDNFAYLSKQLHEIPLFSEYFRTVRVPDNAVASPFGFPLIIDRNTIKKTDIVRFLEERLIRTRPIFSGNITRHPMMEHINYMVDGSLSGCDYIMEKAIWIGCHPELSKVQLDYVCLSFEEFLRA